MLAFLAMLSSIQVDAQRQCKVDFPEKALHPHPYPAQSTRSEAYIIPVIFHVYWGEHLAPIAPTYIRSVIDKTNEMLIAMNPEIESVPEVFQEIVGDAQIELQLATQLPGNECTSGIIYHYHDVMQGPVVHAPYSIETSHYLNIHVFPSSNSYATLPAASIFQNDPADVIVFSTFDINFRIATLAHELGHWFGLYHTFGQVNETGGDCGDDFVVDTPTTRGTLECNPDQIDCTPGVVENVHNHMDYSSCPSMFTEGQVQRMQGVLEDPDLNRVQIHQLENLEYTGAGATPDCERTVELWHKAFPECDSTQVRYSYLVQGGVPDSLKWEFYIPEFTTTQDHMPTHSYTESGTAVVYLYLYFGSETELVIYNHEITVSEIETDLPPIQELPFSLDPDDGFDLPNQHVNLLEAPLDEGWQICDFAGYESNQCLYVPARIVDQEGYADLEMGMFDMTGLTEPKISFRVAAAMVQPGAFHTLQILFRDECSSAFIGDIWWSGSLNALFNNNTASGFIPTSNDQWLEVSANFPAWVLSGHGFITLRLKTNMSPGMSGEPFYIDNFRLGDPETFTSVGNIAASELELVLFPNPARHQLNWKIAARVTSIKVFDSTGRTIFESSQNAQTGSLNVAGWTRGLYFFKLETEQGISVERFVVD